MPLLGFALIWLCVVCICESWAFDPQKFFSNLKHVEEPQIVVYNRIPKCASSTVIALLRILAVQNEFVLLNMNATFWNRPLDSHISLRKHLYDHLRKALEGARRVIIVGHWFWHEIDTNEFGRDIRVEYINMMRECSSRLKSHLVYNYDYSVAAQYYRRKGALEAFHQYILGCDSTLDECLSSKTCVAKMRAPCSPDIMTAYIGGTQETSNEARLDHALGHLNYMFLPNTAGYVAVGLEEYMLQSLRLWECLLPSYFKGATQVYKQQHITAKLYHSDNYNLNMSLLQARICQADEIVYRDAMKIFQSKLDAILSASHVCRNNNI